MKEIVQGKYYHRAYFSTQAVIWALPLKLHAHGTLCLSIVSAVILSLRSLRLKLCLVLQVLWVGMFLTTIRKRKTLCMYRCMTFIMAIDHPLDNIDYYLYYFGETVRINLAIYLEFFCSPLTRYWYRAFRFSLLLRIGNESFFSGL